METYPYKFEVVYEAIRVAFLWRSGINGNISFPLHDVNGGEFTSLFFGEAELMETLLAL